MLTASTAQFSQLLKANTTYVEDTIKQCVKDLEMSGFDIENVPKSIEQLVLVLKELIDNSLSRNDDRIKRFLYQVDIGEELVQKTLFSSDPEQKKDPFEFLAISIVVREYQKTQLKKQYSNE